MDSRIGKPGLLELKLTSEILLEVLIKQTVSLTTALERGSNSPGVIVSYLGITREEHAKNIATHRQVEPRKEEIHIGLRECYFSCCSKSWLKPVTLDFLLKSINVIEWGIV